MLFLKKIIRSISNILKLIVGLLIYLFVKKTPNFAYQAMISLFCLTRGYSNDFLSWLISIFNRPNPNINSNGILGNISEFKVRKGIVSNLNERGFHIFENRLSTDLCDKLIAYATTKKCIMRSMDFIQTTKPVVVIYPRSKPEAVRYDFSTQNLLNNIEVQNIIADTSFASIAQEYLGSRPILDVLGMWWHTSFSDKPDSEAAQYFHFDMDRPKWLKFFIYLTDVETANGPHSFVLGSHRTKGIPTSLLKKGYARLTDDEVKNEFDLKNIVEFNAPRGTIIAEDTRGLHKGKHVTSGDRLILQFQFSNSLFGGKYPKSQFGLELSDKLTSSMIRFPWLYKAFL